MACNSVKNMYYKSAQTAYNDASQAFVATGTQVQILGNLVCNTGCSLSTTGAGFVVNNGGLYRFSFDVIATPSATGTMVLQMYNGTTALPCAVANVTSDASTTETMHIETVVRLNSCCGVQPVIGCQISGVAGTISHVCGSAVKLA